MKISPLENLSIGALWFDYDTIDRSLGNTDGNEFDVYAEWAVTDNVVIMPLVGWYQPDKSADQGGTQLGSNDTNLYSQLMVFTAF